MNQELVGEIKKLIEIYEARKQGKMAAYLVVEDLQSLLKLYQKLKCQR